MFPAATRAWWTAFTPSEYGAVLRGLGALGHVPDDTLWLVELLALLYAQTLRHARGASLAQLMAALEGFGYNPGPAWLHHFCQARARASAQRGEGASGGGLLPPRAPKPPSLTPAHPLSLFPPSLSLHTHPPPKP